jgi:hypothetical protein
VGCSFVSGVALGFRFAIEPESESDELLLARPAWLAHFASVYHLSKSIMFSGPSQSVSLKGGSLCARASCEWRRPRQADAVKWNSHRCEETMDAIADFARRNLHLQSGRRRQQQQTNAAGGDADSNHHDYQAFLAA